MSAASAGFVPTVERIPLARSRGGRPRRNATEDDRDKSPERPAPETRLGGPLYTFGSHGTAALREMGRGKWGWVWINDESGTQLQLETPAVLLFPPTRDPPETHAELPLDVMIASATRFINSTDDIQEPEVVTQLVIEEMQANHDHPKSGGPTQTNLLAVVNDEESTVQQVVLCFPMGRLGEELNLSPFLPTRDSSLPRFVPTSTPAATFPMPILQLEVSPFVSEDEYDAGAKAMLVRLAYSTHLLNIIPNHSSHPTPPRAISVAELSVAATDGHRPVDVALDPAAWSRAAIVDDHGAIWLWCERKEQHGLVISKVMKLIKLRDAVPDLKEPWFRVTFGIRPDTILVLSRTTLEEIDFETPTEPRINTLVTIDEKTHVFTSIDKSATARRAEYICLTTSKEVIWIDDFGRPVLRWGHQYGGGKVRDIEATVLSVPGEDAETVLISAPSFGLVDAIRTSASAPLKFVTESWSIRGLVSKSDTIASLVSLPIGGTTAALASMTVDGAIKLAKLSGPRNEQTLRDVAQPEDAVVWSSHIERLARDRPGPLQRCDWQGNAETKHHVYQGRWAWMYINANDEPVLQLDDFRSAMENWDRPINHIVTAAELARDVVYEGDDGPRPRSKVLRGLTVGDGDVEEVSYSVKFPFMRTIGSRSTAGLTALAATLPDQASVSASVYERISTATARLADDLRLSRVILATDGLSGLSPPVPRLHESPEDLFAKAAGALSLEDPKPPIEFGLLHPTPPIPKSYSSHTPGGSRPYDPASINALLADWTVGDDLDDFTYTDPAHILQEGYMATNRPIRPLPSGRHTPPRTPTKGNGLRAAQSMPTLPGVGSIPSVRGMGSIPPVLGSQRNVIPAVLGSQPSAPPRPSGLRVATRPVVTFSSPPRAKAVESSQAVDFAQTQVMPGPFGARPEAAAKKKKPPKKRMGGF